MFDIRELQAKDLGEAMSLVWEVFIKYQGCNYSEEGINSFKKIIELESIMDGYFSGIYKFWGSYRDEELLGVIAKRDLCHLAMLFVDEESHKLGIGRVLFNTLVLDVKNTGGVKKITVNSSPYAVGFYEKLGFEKIEEEKCVNGIIFIPMIYCLQNFDK